MQEKWPQQLGPLSCSFGALCTEDTAQVTCEFLPGLDGSLVAGSLINCCGACMFRTILRRFRFPAWPSTNQRPALISIQGGLARLSFLLFVLRSLMLSTVF